MSLRLTTLLYKSDVAPGVVGLYNNILGHNFAFVHHETWIRLNSGQLPDQASSLELEKKHFLVPQGFSEERYTNSFKSAHQIDIHLMYLLVSQSCNLACTYCFERLGSDMDRIMPWSVADRAIDYFYQISHGKREIIIYGGEPLLNKDLVVKAIKKIREKELVERAQTEINLLCNGLLVDQEVAQFLAKQNVGASVSIDGPPEVHNLARTHRLGDGSYHQALRGYNLLKNSGVRTSISCTIGKHNVDVLPQVARFIANELKPIAVGFNFLIGGVEQKFDIRHATSQLLIAFQILRDSGIYEDRIMRRLRPIMNGKPHLKDCGAYGNQIVVKYDGSIGPCHAFCNTGDFFSGDLRHSEFKLDHQVFEKWCRRNQFENERCRLCPASLVCGGGCAFNAHVRSGRIEEVDENICAHSFMLLDWILAEVWRKKLSSPPADEQEMHQKGACDESSEADICEETLNEEIELLKPPDLQRRDFTQW